MLSKFASVFGIVVIVWVVLGTVPTNRGQAFPDNGPCTPSIGPGICSDNGIMTWYDAALNKTPFGASGVGPPGPKGDKGDKGDAGSQGIQGIQGIQGPQGAPGTLPGQTCHFTISGFSMDGKGGAAGVLTVTTCP